MDCKISLKNIKKYRKLKSYSQLRLSEEVGVSDTTISRLENDKERSPKLDVIKKVGDVLDVCPFDLMECDCTNKETEMCSYCCKKCERNKGKA